jgi:hypothetical protein
LLTTAGKEGVLYVIDRDRMGHFHAGSDSHAVQTLKAAGTGGFGAQAYWNGHLYSFGSNDVLRDFAVNAGRLTLAHQGSSKFIDPGAIPVVSANGAKDGIVWIALTKGWRDRGTYGSLQAYDAADVSHLLYSTLDNPSRDGAGIALRFTLPTVADGRVYVGYRRAVYVYGLLETPKKLKH